MWEKYRYASHLLTKPIPLACPVCGCTQNGFKEAFLDDGEHDKAKKEIAIPMTCALDHRWELVIKKGLMDFDDETTTLNAKVLK